MLAVAMAIEWGMYPKADEQVLAKQRGDGGLSRRGAAAREQRRGRSRKRREANLRAGQEEDTTQIGLWRKDKI